MNTVALPRRSKADSAVLPPKMLKRASDGTLYIPFDELSDAELAHAGRILAERARARKGNT